MNTLNTHRSDILMTYIYDHRYSDKKANTKYRAETGQIVYINYPNVKRSEENITYNNSRNFFPTFYLLNFRLDG